MDPIKENEPQGTHFTISDSKFSDAFGFEEKGEGNDGTYNGDHGMSHTNDSAYIHIIIYYCSTAPSYYKKLIIFKFIII